MPLYKINSKGFTHLLLLLTLGLLFGAGTGFFGFKNLISRSAQNNIAQQDVLQASTTRRPIVVDHNSVALFDSIPQQYIDAAKNLDMLFIDRSVGGNISDGLSCLAYSSAASAPSHCRRPDIQTSELVANTMYSRANWDYQYWDSTGNCSEWYDKVRCFLDMTRPVMNNYDVMSYQFSYLEVGSNSNIDNPTSGFFGDNRYDVRDIEAWEAQNPSKTFIYWTTSLARGTGTQVSTNFNQQMRNYAISNNKVLFDVADILSHDKNGNPCYDNRDGVPYSNGNNSENYPNDGQNYPAICQSYTTETDGGHLGSDSAGKIRVAKAFWVLMAQIAGWNPGTGGGTTPPPPPPPTEPTNTPPVVNAGQDRTTDVNVAIAITGTATDDGRPSNTLTYNWELRSGPGTASISNPSSLSTNMTFPTAGTYVLRLNATDSQLSSFDDMVVSVVNPPAPPVPPTVPGSTNPAGLVSYFNFDSSTLTDSVNSCSDCSVVGPIWTNIGLRGGAFTFDGTNDYIKLGPIAALNDTDDLSVSIWVKPNFDQTNSNWFNALSFDSAFSIFYLSNINDWRATINTSSSRALLDTQNITWNANTWIHIAITYDGANAKLYWNGQNVATKPLTGNLKIVSAPKYIGTSQVKSQYFNGVIDEVKIFNTALSSQDIQALYNAR